MRSGPRDGKEFELTEVEVDTPEGTHVCRVAGAYEAGDTSVGIWPGWHVVGVYRDSDKAELTDSLSWSTLSRLADKLADSYESGELAAAHAADDQF